MPQRFHLFDPENDLALGLGCRNYTPPPHAAALHRAGSLFPMWWAEEGDRILAPESLKESATLLREKFGLNGEPGYSVEVTEFQPWGWSLDAKRQFLTAMQQSGNSRHEELHPTDSKIERLRELSHRRSSIKILSELDMDIALPVEATDADTVITLEREYPGCFIKSPWSSSGRGVFNASSLDEETLRKRAEGIINRQGSVMVERGLNKSMDFATLFHSSEGRVTFQGLSLFTALQRGMYTGNIVSSQDKIAEILSKHLNIDSLHLIILKLEKILTELIGKDYTGWAGVDMMTHISDGKEMIMPCVELNLRMTMGVAAMKIYEKLTPNGIHILNWEHNTPIGKGEIELLPPIEGFSLRLKPQP